MNTGDRSDNARGDRLADRRRWRATSDADLVAAVRKGRYDALREFYARFEPLLARYAARAGVSLESWEDDAHNVLCDVVLSLIALDKGGRKRPRDDVRDIHSYIQRAFRNRMLDARRSAARREQRDTRATSSDAATSERMVLATCSESAVRASSGEDHDPSALSPAIARLATVLGAELSSSERQMLTWVGNAVPMRDIATWFEINYSAAKVRLSRTRSRLRVRALRHVNECTGAEREELIDFFRRSSGEVREGKRARAHGAAAAQPSRTAEPGGAHGDH
jgi:DNA-directed RNA polymerase specialized sigma24 family protein